MRLDNLRYRAFCAYRLVSIAVVVLATLPATSWAATETPSSPLRNPLSGVTRFLGPQPYETGTSRIHAPRAPRREAENHVVRKASPQPIPAYGYRYAYAGYYYAYPRYYYPYINAAWAGYPYRRYAYYYSPIPGFAGH